MYIVLSADYIEEWMSNRPEGFFVKPAYFFKNELKHLNILPPSTWFWGTQIMSRSHAKTSQDFLLS